MMVRQAMDWRRLLNYTVLRFESLLRKNGIKTESEDFCVIFDDTTLEKTGRKLEHITKVFDHVKMNYVLGYKLLLCLFFDGKSSLPFDFSIHEELGDKGDGGLGKKTLRKRFSKKRTKGSPAYEREQECGMSKMDSAVRMLQRMWKCGLRPHYALADSWFACEKFIAAIRNIGKGAIHYIGLAKWEIRNTSSRARSIMPQNSLQNTQDGLNTAASTSVSTLCSGGTWGTYPSEYT